MYVLHYIALIFFNCINCTVVNALKSIYICVCKYRQVPYSLHILFNLCLNNSDISKQREHMEALIERNMSRR